MSGGEDSVTEDEEEEEKKTEKQPKVPMIINKVQRPKSRRDLRWEQRRNSRNRGREHVVVDRRRSNRSLLLPRFGQRTMQRPSTAHSISSSSSRNRILGNG